MLIVAIDFMERWTVVGAAGCLWHIMGEGLSEECLCFVKNEK